jgi:hypothetical protein
LRAARGAPSMPRVFSVRTPTAPAPAAGSTSTEQVRTSPVAQEPAAMPFRSIDVTLWGGPERSNVTRQERRVLRPAEVRLGRRYIEDAGRHRHDQRPDGVRRPDIMRLC